MDINKRAEEIRSRQQETTTAKAQFSQTWLKPREAHIRAVHDLLASFVEWAQEHAIPFDVVTRNEPNEGWLIAQYTFPGVHYGNNEWSPGSMILYWVNPNARLYSQVSTSGYADQLSYDASLVPFILGEDKHNAYHMDEWAKRWDILTIDMIEERIAQIVAERDDLSWD